MRMTTRVLIRTAAFAGLTLLALLALASGGWGALALGYSGPTNDAVRTVLIAAFVLACLAAAIGLCVRRWRWRALGVYLLLFAGLVLWWRSIEPSNERQWQTDVAVLPYATIDGNLVTMHNVRNFDYRSETDYSPAYYDKRFDLEKLQGVD